MPFVKLDTGILDSTLWVERECREVFITALLMAVPKELTEAMPQIEARSITLTGWSVPPGWYGFIEAAGVGITRRAMVDGEAGLAALDKLGSPDPESRSKDFEGRRLVRVDGGFVVLNFFRYRDKDHTAADRMRRYRDRKKNEEHGGPDDTGQRRNVASRTRNVTQAEAEAEAEAPKRSEPATQVSRLPAVPHDKVRALWGEILPAMPQPAAWGPVRQGHLRARWREMAAQKKWVTEADGLEFFRRMFVYIGKSPFLTGRAGTAGKRPFEVELPWLLLPENFVKVIEGKYHQEAA